MFLIHGLLCDTDPTSLSCCLVFVELPLPPVMLARPEETEDSSMYHNNSANINI